jgi:PAS domain S-box-containing protein
MQYNKRDLADAMPVGVMNRRLNFRSVPYFESVASRGDGVLETFLAITRETVGTTFRKYHLDKKIKDFDEMLNLIESNVRANMQELPAPAQEPAPAASVVLRHNVSVADLIPGKVADAQDLLEDALKSNMETARLYSELKTAKEALEKKNEELRQIYTQLERANQDNLKTRRYLEGLIQSVGEAIISFSADGRILTWNAAAEQIFGYPRAEIVGRTFHQLTPPSRAGELEQVIAQVGKGQTIRDVVTSRLRKDGTEFPASITYAPIRGSDDRVLANSALIRDLGVQQQLQQKLEEMESAAGLSRIMPGLFNDLANRLTPILMQKDRLMEDPAAPDQLDRLLQSVANAQALLRPLLVLLYPVVPRLESANLNSLLQEAARQVEAQAAAAGVALEFTLDPNLKACALDPGLLREGIVCLLRSGIGPSAASAAKRLRLGTRQNGQTLQLVCQNTGRALTEPEAKRIFELAAVRDVESLDLCVMAGIAQAHGGRISVRSQEGLGNAFLVELPMAEAELPIPPTALQGKRVLVVDDEPFLLECLVDAIGSWGCEVVPCALASDAVTRLQGDSFDGIISDIRMPGLTGIQLYEWLQANQPRMAGRILFTTGDTFDPTTRAFLERTQVPSLGKPFDLKKLKEALGSLLA